MRCRRWKSMQAARPDGVFDPGQRAKALTRSGLLMQCGVQGVSLAVAPGLTARRLIQAGDAADGPESCGIAAATGVKAARTHTARRVIPRAGNAGAPFMQRGVACPTVNCCGTSYDSYRRLQNPLFRDDRRSGLPAQGGRLRQRAMPALQPRYDDNGRRDSPPCRWARHQMRELRPRAGGRQWRLVTWWVSWT